MSNAKQRHCCTVGCERPAEYEVWAMGTNDPHGYSDACEAHVGEMLGFNGLPLTTPDAVWWEVRRVKPEGATT